MERRSPRLSVCPGPRLANGIQPVIGRIPEPQPLRGGTAPHAGQIGRLKLTGLKGPLHDAPKSDWCFYQVALPPVVGCVLVAAGLFSLLPTDMKGPDLCDCSPPSSSFPPSGLLPPRPSRGRGLPWPQRLTQTGMQERYGRSHGTSKPRPWRSPPSSQDAVMKAGRAARKGAAPRPSLALGWRRSIRQPVERSSPLPSGRAMRYAPEWHRDQVSTTGSSRLSARTEARTGVPTVDARGGCSAWMLPR